MTRFIENFFYRWYYISSGVWSWVANLCIRRMNRHLDRMRSYDEFLREEIKRLSE